jgi:hypothetical protein
MRMQKGRCSVGDGGVVAEGLARMRARLCFQLLSFSPQTGLLVANELRVGFQKPTRKQTIQKSLALPLEANAQIRRTEIRVLFERCVPCCSVLSLCLCYPLAREGTARDSSEHIPKSDVETSNQKASNSPRLSARRHSRWQQSHNVSPRNKSVLGDSHTCSPGLMARKSALEHSLTAETRLTFLPTETPTTVPTPTLA